MMFGLICNLITAVFLVLIHLETKKVAKQRDQLADEVTALRLQNAMLLKEKTPRTVTKTEYIEKGPGQFVC